jgi:Ran GTPase-activating protein (RanGAP) involved in mRNA processing and transport
VHPGLQTTKASADAPPPPIAPTHVRALAEALVGMSNLLTLAFWSVDVRDEGAACLASWIAGNRAVQNLELSGCSIGAAGCKALGEGLERNGGLCRLALDNNPVGDAGASALGARLAYNRTLTEVSLAYCGLSGEAASALTTGVMRLATLRSLELKGNSIGAEGVTSLLGAATKHGALFRIGLADTSCAFVDGEVAAALVACATENTSLGEYDLRGNPMGDGTAYAITKLAKEGGHLVEVLVSESVDTVLFKQLLDVVAANRKEWLKKNKKKKGGKGGKKGGGKKKGKKK